MTVLKQIVLSRRPVKNREVSLNEGGDCGACVLAGLLGLPDAADAYELHRPGSYLGGTAIPKIHHFTRRSMIDTLEALASDHGCRGGLDGVPVLLDHVVTDIPIWPFHQHDHELAFGLRSQFEWRDYARALLNGGYYGLAQVKHGGYQPDGPIRDHGMTDHWVMICGWRYVFLPETDEARRAAGCGGHYEEHFLIGDSSRARPLETWVPANDLQRFWGGFTAIWARPLHIVTDQLVA